MWTNNVSRNTPWVEKCSQRAASLKSSLEFYLPILFWTVGLVGTFQSSLSWSFTHSLVWRSGISSYLLWDVFCLLARPSMDLFKLPLFASSVLSRPVLYISAPTKKLCHKFKFFFFTFKRRLLWSVTPKRSIKTSAYLFALHFGSKHSSIWGRPSVSLLQ